MKLLLIIVMMFFSMATSGMNHDYFIYLTNLQYSLPLKIKEYRKKTENVKRPHEINKMNNAKTKRQDN